MGTLYIGVILIMRVVQNYYSKKASTIFPSSARGRIKYLALSFGLSALLALAVLLVSGGFSAPDAQGTLIAAGSGAALACATVCNLLAMQSGTVMIASVFATAGLIVPCVGGIFFFGEPMSVMQWLGVAVFIGASVLLADASKKANAAFSPKTVLLLIGSFLANGATMLFQKLFTYTRPDGDITLFTLLTFAIPAILFALPLVRAGNGGERLNSKLYVPIAALAAAVAVISQLATAATQYVSSAPLFALINGGNTIIAVIVAAAVYHEKPTLRAAAGLFAALAALIVINIF